MITELIPTGRMNAIKRSKLAEVASNVYTLCDNDTDREVRKMIADARAEGNVILTRTDGGYYMLPDDSSKWTSEEVEDLRRFSQGEHNRAMKILVNSKAARYLYEDYKKERLV